MHTTTIATHYFRQSGFEDRLDGRLTDERDDRVANAQYLLPLASHPSKALKIDKALPMLLDMSLIGLAIVPTAC